MQLKPDALFEGRRKCLFFEDLFLSKRRLLRHVNYTIGPSAEWTFWYSGLPYHSYDEYTFTDEIVFAV